MDLKLQKKLEKFALKIRIATVECIRSIGFGHIGGSLSIADILAVLYGEVMHICPDNPLMEDRDKLVCSKGHAGPAIYAALALKGFFPYNYIKTLNQPYTNFPSHCDRKKTIGIDMTTGSLGHGASLAVGMAIGDKFKGRNSKTYVIIGDGELNEGQIWEAAMFAAANKVTNLIWIIDNNKYQLDGAVSDILNPFDIRAKFDAFGFDAIRVNGNNVCEVYEALIKNVIDKPLVIVLDTIKGKGIPEIESNKHNHSMNVDDEVWERWLNYLQNQLKNF